MFPESSFQSEVNVTSLALLCDCLSFDYSWLEVNRNLELEEGASNVSNGLVPCVLKSCPMEHHPPVDKKMLLNVYLTA